VITFFQHLLRFTIIRFLIGGSVAATVTIGTVFILTEVYDVWYLFAAITGSSFAICINFILQKFWTFRETTLTRAHTQTAHFFLVNIGNLILNAVLMVFFVEVVGLWPVFAQVCSGGLIAIESFLAYSFIFRTS
jgi:putative flippase GtrA